MQPSLNPPAGEVIEPDRPLGLLPVSQDGVRQFTCMEVGQVHHFNMTKSEFSSKTIRGISEHLRRMVVHVCGVRHEDHTSDPETRSPVDCPIRNLTVASPDLNLACAHPGHVASTLTHYIAILKGLKRIDDAHAAALQQKLEDAVAELHKLDATAIDRYDNLRHGAHEENTKIRMGIKEEQKVIGEKMADVVQVLRDEFDAMLLQF